MNIHGSKTHEMRHNITQTWAQKSWYAQQHQGYYKKDKPLFQLLSPFCL
jgi:hypothetical protein